MLELFSGLIQDCPKILESELDDETLELDKACSDWPPECAKEYLDLASQCLLKRKNRIGRSLLVLRSIRSMEAKFARKTQMEEALAEKLKRQSEELERMKGTLEAAQLMAKPPFSCPICFDTDIPASNGVTCGRTNGPQHTMCKSCFSLDVTTQSKNLAEFTDNDSKIVCSMCLRDREEVDGKLDFVRTQYTSRDIYKSCDNDACNAYEHAGKAVERFNESAKARAREEVLKSETAVKILEMELKVHEHNEKERLNATANLHRHRIVDEILTARCPNCKLVFVDWTHCFAVKCDADFTENGQEVSRGCKKYFCGWVVKLI